MNKNLLASIFFFTLLSSCSPINQTTISGASPSLSIQEYFPLKNGAYWVYQGNVRWTIANSSEVSEKEITWKMEVRRVIPRNDIVGYEMLGAPWDLAWYEEGQVPNEYGIIQAGGNFYRTSLDTVRRLLDEKDSLKDLVGEYDIFLDVPLIQGKKFCDLDSLIGANGMYCWVVGDVSPENISNIKDIASSDAVSEFSIYNRTNPDHSIIKFIPGVGISGYEYHHHGTISDVEVRLIEYHSGE